MSACLLACLLGSVRYAWLRSCDVFVFASKTKLMYGSDDGHSGNDSHHLPLTLQFSLLLSYGGGTSRHRA